MAYGKKRLKKVLALGGGLANLMAMKATKHYCIESKGKLHKFATLDAAKRCASEIFEASGVVVGIFIA